MKNNNYKNSFKYKFYTKKIEFIRVLPKILKNIACFFQIYIIVNSIIFSYLIFSQIKRKKDI